MQVAEHAAFHGLEPHADEAQAAGDRVRRQTFADEHLGVGYPPVAQRAPGVPVTEVLQMIVDGKSNKEIAAALDLSANTIAVHRANIMNTLGIHKTAELVVYAIRAGLVNVP